MIRTTARLLLVAAAGLCPSGARGQEHVVNGGFEAFSRCPTGPGLIDGWLDDWHRTSVASTDYHNTCGFSGHAPRAGEGHVGLLAYDFSANYREYATGMLNPPLEAGQVYRLDFWVLLSPDRLHAIGELGGWFSATQPTWPGTGPPAGVVPQVENTTGPLTDKVNWTLVSGSFVAAGGERYVTIGNFHDDASTTITGWPCCGGFGAYYHVDDVSVRKAGLVPLDVSCALLGDSCLADSAASGDGRLDFDEEVALRITVSNPGGADLTSYRAVVSAANAAITSPAGGAIAVATIPVGGSADVVVTLQLPPAGMGVACGDAVAVTLSAQASDQGTWPDATLDACGFRIGDPAGDCGACVAPPCLHRADATSLDPLTPPAALLFMPETPQGLSLRAGPWQCPFADLDLEREPMALLNGVPLSLYQVDRPVDTLRLEKAGTTIRFRF